MTAYTATGVAASVVSGRLSYTFGLRGPALTIDTACSSSLVGLHMAFNALLLGQCESAAGAGVNLILHPETLAIAQKAGMLTPDGRCKTLSATADGYGRAEACGVVMLETADSPAAADGGGSAPPAWLAVVAGSAVNQDGRSSSLTAPNGPSQQSVLRAALQVARLAAEHLTALQMHGTGTALGDPIEVGAAAAALVPPSRAAPLVLMSSKSWLGHAEPAAGVVGLTHAQAALTQSAQLPVVHLASINPYVTAVMGKHHAGWAIPRQPASLTPAAASLEGLPPAVVGVSAFAFQGTNAHVLIQAVTSTDNGRTAPLGGSTTWHKQRHWVAPPAHR